MGRRSKKAGQEYRIGQLTNKAYDLYETNKQLENLLDRERNSTSYLKTLLFIETLVLLALIVLSFV